MFHYAYCINSTNGFTYGNVYRVTYPSSVPYGHTCFLTENDSGNDDRIYYGNKDNFIFILNTNKSIEQIKSIFKSITE